MKRRAMVKPQKCIFYISLTTTKLHVIFHFLHRIFPQSRDARPNPEETVDEDEDVQEERLRTATALTTSKLDEVEKHMTH